MFKVLNKKKAPAVSKFAVLGGTSRQSQPNTITLSREWRNIEVLSEIAKGDYSRAHEFTGFGGLHKALQNEDVQGALMDLLSAEEWESLRKSTSTAYYTSPEIIKYCWQIVEQLGFAGGDILEPACGIGSFFEYMPESMRQRSAITGIELEKVTAHIASSLYQDVTIINNGFQHHKGEYDLLIGNPPYASFSVNDRYFPELNDFRIHHAFLARSIKLLREGGLCVMVVPSYCLDNSTSHARALISEEADLLYAYRLPDSIWADTKITTDIVVFQKTSNPAKDWQGISAIELDCGYTDNLSDYYIKHPEHLLGKLEKYEVWLSKEQRKRRGLSVSGSMTEVMAKLPSLIDDIEPVCSGQGAIEGCVIDFKQKVVHDGDESEKADTGDYGVLSARLDAVVQELAEITRLLQQQAA